MAMVGRRAKAKWDIVVGNATLMRRVNGWLTIASIVLVPVAIILQWTKSVEFVSALSIWALVAGHWSAWQGARVEEKQDAAEEKQDAAEASSSE